MSCEINSIKYSQIKLLVITNNLEYLINDIKVDISRVKFRLRRPFFGTSAAQDSEIGNRNAVLDCVIIAILVKTYETRFTKRLPHKSLGNNYRISLQSKTFKTK